MTSAVVITAALGILLGSAGTASAQDPWGKYPTKARCEAVGKKVTEEFGGIQSCVHHASAPSSQRWWLYVI